jgi:hypothetical protein
MLEEKIEELTKEVVALRQAIEKNGTVGAKAAAAKPAAKPKADEDDDEADAKPAAKKPSAKKPKADEPDHDEDEVGSIFRKAAKLDKPRCKKYLAKVDCEDLAELLTQPDLFDAAYAFAEKVIADAAEEDDDDD